MEYLKGAFAAACAVAVAALIAAYGLLTYGPGSERQVLERVRNSLTDPASAQFKDVVVGDYFVCGRVNAKNRMGGYIGFQRFLAYRYIEDEAATPYFESDSILGPMVALKWDLECVPDKNSQLSQLETAVNLMRR